jgi:choline dehydrogenase
MLWPAMAYVGQLRVKGVDWRFESEPQKNSSLGLNGQRVKFPRGKGLGGSSNLNLMYYQRGNQRDFNRWGEVTGDEEWNFDNVMPYFKATANYHGNNPNGN